MSIPALTRAQVRQVDRAAIQEWNIPGLVLMENAGRGVADVLCGLGIEGRVQVVCAKGNNGGDGLVLARHLKIRGVDVEVILSCTASELRGDALANYEWLSRCHVPIQQLDTSDATAQWPPGKLAAADWIVDALLGTGAVGAPRPPLDRIIESMNGADGKRLAIDVPSGLDCDQGLPANSTFRADHTCTLVAPKTGFAKPEAQAYVGELHVLDIGLPEDLVLQCLNVDETDLLS